MILNIEKTDDGLLVNLPDQSTETLALDEGEFCKALCELLEREMPEQAIEAVGDLTDKAREVQGKLPKVDFGGAKTLSDLGDVGAAYAHDNAAALARSVHKAAKGLNSGPSGRGRRFSRQRKTA